MIEYGKPYTLEPVADNISNAIYPCKIKFNKPLIFEIADAEIVGYPPLGFDRDGGIILETTSLQGSPVKTHVEKNLPLRNILIKNLPTFKSHKSNTVSLLINSRTNNYWHWLIDFLTRFEGLEYYKKQTGVKPKLIVPGKMYAWQSDSLKTLGYGPDDCIVWKPIEDASRQTHHTGFSTSLLPTQIRQLRVQLLPYIGCAIKLSVMSLT